MYDFLIPNIYDIDQLIADVGGYMGLLLGHSALSIYYKLEAWCGKRTTIEKFFSKKEPKIH